MSHRFGPKRVKSLLAVGRRPPMPFRPATARNKSLQNEGLSEDGLLRLNRTIVSSARQVLTAILGKTTAGIRLYQRTARIRLPSNLDSVMLFLSGCPLRLARVCGRVILIPGIFAKGLPTVAKVPSLGAQLQEFFISNETHINFSYAQRQKHPANHRAGTCRPRPDARSRRMRHQWWPGLGCG